MRPAGNPAHAPAQPGGLLGSAQRERPLPGTGGKLNTPTKRPTGGISAQGAGLGAVCMRICLCMCRQLVLACAACDIHSACSVPHAARSGHDSVASLATAVYSSHSAVLHALQA
jgi:hypothetical protein